VDSTLKKVLVVKRPCIDSRVSQWQRSMQKTLIDQRNKARWHAPRCFGFSHQIILQRIRGLEFRREEKRGSVCRSRKCYKVCRSFVLSVLRNQKEEGDHDECFDDELTAHGGSGWTHTQLITSTTSIWQQAFSVLSPFIHFHWEYESNARRKHLG